MRRQGRGRVSISVSVLRAWSRDLLRIFIPFVLTSARLLRRIASPRARPQLARLPIERRSILTRDRFGRIAVTSVAAASGVTQHRRVRRIDPLFLSPELSFEGLLRALPAGREGHIALSPYVLARISLSFLFAIRRCGKKREIAQRSNRTPERASRVLLRSKQTARPRLAIDRFAVALHRDGP